MSNRKTIPFQIRPALAVVLAAGAGVGAIAVAVLACGPDFPLQLLDDRAGALKSTPANSFAFEVAHMAPVSDRLTVRETNFDPFEAGAVAPPVSAARQAETPKAGGAFSTAQLAKIKAMREAANGDAAYALGDGLPPAVRLYTAGAVDYLAASPQAEKIVPLAPLNVAQAAQAQRRFEAVLALPAADGDLRSVWAAYMLGQGHANAMQGANSAADAKSLRAAAVRAYALARTRANSGAFDSDGLAVASFGEQARLYLIQDTMLCSYRDFANATACADGIAPADLKQAIHLYIEQAAHGSVSGLQSLHYIAAWLLNDKTRASRVIDDPLVQRLLVAFALARVGDIADDDPATASYFGLGESTGRTGYVDAAQGKPNIKTNPALQSLVLALQARGIDRIDPLAGADRLAALAYRTGRYDLAQSLIDKQPGALSSWVRAKLALRRGDTAGAAKAYVEAAKAFPQSDASLEPASAALLKAEQGVLTLSRGQYVEALDQLYAAAARVDADAARYSVGSPYGDYTGDAFYVAERVVTTDELKTYVDAHVPANPAGTPAGFAAFTPEQYWAWLGQHPKRVADRLRQLLVRRLVREGRVAEALPYFPDDDDARYIERSEYDAEGNARTTLAASRMRQSAKEYGAALDDAQHAWRATARAQGWYKAAVLARQNGMEIMGYEQAPDFAELGGALAFGTGRAAAAPTMATPEARAAAEVPGPLVTDEERKRYAASESSPNKRYHYRDIAVEDIMRSADLLPPRSQAFAAVLCQGAGFIRYDGGIEKLYRRYVKEGAYVPFAKDFGSACAEPDFRAAAWFPYVQAWRRSSQFVRRLPARLIHRLRHPHGSRPN